MISLRTNSAALVALRNMNQTQVRLEENLQRLSSGLRLNSAADDPAGIGMSVKFEARIRSLGQAERNAQDGQNLLETAGGGLTEISGLLSKIRELAVEASDATVSTSDRADLNLEFNELREEIDRLAENMEYNDISLLNGSASTLTLHVGADGGASDQLRIGISDTRVAALSGLSIASFSSAGAASSAISSIDGAIDIVNTTQASVGSSLNRLDASLGALGTERDNLIAANSQIRDADLAVEASEFARNQVLMDAGLAVLAQANAMGSRVVGLIG
jgi:flagellin